MCLRKLWVTAEEEKVMSVVVGRLRALIVDHGKPAELNADGEFDNKTFNRFVSQQGIAVRFKEGRQDLATIDAAMRNFKKMLKRMMQEQNTSEWAKLLPKATRAQPAVARSVDGECRPQRSVRCEP